MRQEGLSVAPRECGISIPNRDGHDGNPDALSNAEGPAKERIDAIATSRAFGEVQNGHTGLEHRVHTAQDARTCTLILSLDEDDTERRADRSDDRPALDFRLCERRCRTDRQDRERVEIADVICNDQRSTARNVTANRHVEVVCARDGTDSTREAVNCGAAVARRSHACSTKLCEHVEQAASRMSRRTNQLESDHA